MSWSWIEVQDPGASPTELVKRLLTVPLVLPLTAFMLFQIQHSDFLKYIVMHFSTQYSLVVSSLHKKGKSNTSIMAKKALNYLSSLFFSLLFFATLCLTPSKRVTWASEQLTHSCLRVFVLAYLFAWNVLDPEKHSFLLHIFPISVWKSLFNEDGSPYPSH